MTKKNWKEQNEALMTSDSKTWQTPPDLFQYLNEEGRFTLDPCAQHGFEMCPKNYYEEDDGLSKSWVGERVFINPPYGRAELNEWFRVIMEEHKRNHTYMRVLIPGRMDRAIFHGPDGILANCQSIAFVRGRLKFYEQGVECKDAAPFPSIVITFDWNYPTAYKMRSLFKQDGIWLETKI